MLWIIKIKCKQILSRQSTNTLMTAGSHVVVKLLTVSRMYKVDYQISVTRNAYRLGTT